MKVHFENLYRKTTVAPIVHGKMKYHCNNCGESWAMYLEIGVEDNGKNGKPHQPCPFCIPCKCGGFAVDISGYIPLPLNRNLLPGMKYFAYDQSKKENACGKMSIYMGKENKMNDNDIIKALGCCRNGSDCDGCRYGYLRTKNGLCVDTMHSDARALINRQKAEIERLNHIRAELSKEIDKLRDMVAQNEGVLPRYEQLIKTEAIKEFAEKLKERAVPSVVGVRCYYNVVSTKGIDNLVKEMTEGEDGN